MRTIQSPNYLRRSLLVNNHGFNVLEPEYTQVSHKKRILDELHSLGISNAGLMSMEGRYLANVIRQDEHLTGVVYGYSSVGFSMLVVTNFRVLFLDRKPLFMNEDEITFDVISGVTLTNSVFWTNITLHTRIKDYGMLTFNRKAAHKFARYIEERCLEHRFGEICERNH